MLWCPKCKIDYREGVSVCADCGTPLVEEHELQTVVASGDEEKMTTLKQYLEYNQLRHVKIFLDEELQAFSVSVQEKDRETAAEYVDIFMKEQALDAIKDEETEFGTKWSVDYYHGNESENYTEKMGKVIVGTVLVLAALVAFLFYLQ